MSPTELSVAILGAGIWAKEADLPAIAALQSAQVPIKVEAVYSRSTSSASALAEAAQQTLKLNSGLTVYSDAPDREGLDELLARSDIQAVIVVLPLGQQPEIVIKALKAGKHVLSEKPVAKDVKAALELIKTYETEYKPKGLIWRVAENFECEPGIRAAAEAIRSGKIGKVAFFRLSVVNYIDQESKWYQTSWRTVPDYQGGFLLDGGVHSMAVLRTILPSPVVSLSGHASLTKPYLLPHDSIQSVLALDSGAHGILELSFAAPSSARGESLTVITGTEGFLELTSGKNETGVQGWTIKTVVGTKDPKEEKQFYKGQGIDNEIEWFVQAVLKGEQNSVSVGEPRGAIRDVALIQAALTSGGALVDIKKLVEEA
ncbi:hypothetical protein M407DRAFT_118073 [Tulasnella calospora MUT 4182]|uniref:Gfo/Idh/MocA-like oxidoreductase N-terminal domain-containing protein n=1 Tax=Tulasnella calospora MUT 4182 TaxID=1051891 RepID=A0A0C3LM59_9AGAM|nr:hypothetical protein M407DRAFT_118073 [Tulasnella calospora MUT 4182]